MPEESRYSVTKVRSIQGTRRFVASFNRQTPTPYSNVEHSIGFYSVIYNLGFRDDFNPSTHDIVGLVSELEGRVDPAKAIKVIAETETAAARTSHMCVLSLGPTVARC